MVLVLGFLVAWLGPLTSVQAAAPGTPAPVPSYVSNDQQHTALCVESAAERGPSVGLARSDTFTYNAVDCWSPRAGAPAVGARYAYDYLPPLAQAARPTSTTNEHAQAAGTDLSSLARAGVAAKTLPEVKPNATVRDLLDIAPGNAREPLKSGLASRRTDQELLDSVMRPRDGTHMTVSRDGALLEGNHRRFELLDRARDPRSTINWDTPIFLDGWPW